MIDESALNLNEYLNYMETGTKTPLSLFVSNMQRFVSEGVLSRKVIL